MADICCEGRVVSVLEGGYGRTPRNDTSSSLSDDLNQLDKTAFAECAIRHLRSMIDPFDAEKLNPHNN